jgi:redox-sensitive bicupin YhaK (pirin superfamily)
VFKSSPTLEGAGVRLKRAFGYSEVPTFDPFLLLDEFGSDDPEDYLQGFPWHPHRGIETITYVLSGAVEHQDSMGNRGVIRSGDVQWMTAGSGIVHQEMPLGSTTGRMWGFQLWANLPASHKMMAPRYQEVQAAQIPEVTLETGTRIKVICGEVDGVRGPVEDIVTDPVYLDVTVPAETTFNRVVKLGYTVFAYVIEGSGCFCEGTDPYAHPVRGSSYFDMDRDPCQGRGNVVLLGEGDQVAVSTEQEPIRFLLFSGKPIREPVAWYGPIVMNTQEELRIAFDEYRNGTFIKS